MDVRVDFEHSRTITFNDFTVYCPENDEWFASILDPDIDFGNGLTCKRLGGKCYLSNGLVKSTDILIIIRTICSCDNTNAMYSLTFNTQYEYIIHKRYEPFNIHIPMDELDINYEKCLQSFRRFRATHNKGIVCLIVGDKRYNFIGSKISEYRKRVNCDIAFEVLSVIIKYDINANILLEVNELIINDYYTTITNVDSAVEFAESFRPRIKGAISR